MPKIDTPRKESIAKRAIALLKERGVAMRTGQIAEALGESTSSIMPCLAPWAENGTLIVCKVEKPGSRATNEYRISGGGKAMKWIDQSQKKPPTPVIETPAAPAAGDSAEEKATRVARKAAKVQKLQRNTAPSSAPDGFRCGIFSDGSFVIHGADGDIVLAPPEMRAMCAYLDRTLARGEVGA